MRVELLGTSFVPQHSDARVLEQLRSLGERDEPTIDYSISGHIRVDGIPFPLPFQHQDTLTLPGFEKRDKKDGGVQPAASKAIAI